MKNSDREKRQPGGSVFRFKKFEVDQADCAMKINTDGVLLGAMAGSRPPRIQAPTHISASGSGELLPAPGRILDIGTGTGVIALMLAQRFPLAEVDALEIDAVAAARAGTNFQASPFADRLEVFHIALKDYQPSPAVEKYDLIVSNPPFFIDALRNPDPRKQLARHTDAEFFQVLLERSAQWLHPGGCLQLILPPDLAQTIELSAHADFGFTYAEKTEIYSFPEDRQPVRILLSLFKDKDVPAVTQALDRFVIYHSPRIYSIDYQQLLKDFFIIF